MKYHLSARTLRTGASLKEAASAVILIHGRGASADDILGLSEYLPQEGVAYAAPDATDGVWYPQRFFVPLAENEPWLSDALGLIGETVAAFEQAGIPAEKIGIAGFSQGACLALEYAARHPRRYAFIGGLSGALIGPPETPRPPVDLQGTPVLVACAEWDPHFPLPLVRQSIAQLKSWNTELTEQIYRGGDHTVFPEEIQWLTARIGEL